MAYSELADLRKQCITSLYLCTDNISKYLDKEKVGELQKLRSYVLDYCMLEAKQEVAFQALDKTKKETDSSNVDTLEERFADHLSSMADKRAHPNHPYILEFDKRVEKGRQTANQNLDESDLAITESVEQYLDPITKKPIVDPVKNSVCGHVYEKDVIMKMINMKERTKCPVAGCGNRGPIQHQHLLSDEELKFRMTLTQHSTMVQDTSVMELNSTLGQ